MNVTKAPDLKRVKVRGGFWEPRVRLVKDVVLPYQWAVLNDQVPGVAPSHAIENFRIAAGEREGQFQGMVFQDSDVAKWLEAVGYVLAQQPDPQLEATADAVIDLIARAQQSDGYLNTYFTVAAPDKRWTNLRDAHELYCAGHLMEAAVAYYEATGKRTLLDVCSRLADHIATVLGRGPGQKRGYCGHPEVELALVKLYRATGQPRYLELARYFVEERGRQPHWYEIEAQQRGESSRPMRPYDLSYSQAHLPIREQTSIEGHSVRALYLFSGVADVAVETGDQELLEVCRRVWENLVRRRLYVTGAAGSQAAGERFTFDYDLPNDRAYAETCANIAVVFFAHRLLSAEPDGRYADTMELALYNSVLSGISLDGTRYFYVNPLEVWPPACEGRRDTAHVKAVRQGWFPCACCPPNVARLLASLGRYTYAHDAQTAYVHLYIAGEAELDLAGGTVRLVQETGYPWQETVRLTVQPARPQPFTLALRIPGWCQGARLAVNGQPVELAPLVRRGYARLERVWQPGDTVELTLPMPVERLAAHPEVRANAGRVAIRRGPIIYCLEEVDNGPNLAQLVLPPTAGLQAHWQPDLLGGVVVVTAEGCRVEDPAPGDTLYRPVHSASRPSRPVQLTFVPYAFWCNRQPGEMLVWVREG